MYYFGAMLPSLVALRTVAKRGLASACVLIFAALTCVPQAEAAGQYGQRGGKLAGTGATGPSSIKQGSAIAVSADGNTAIVGGIGDNTSVGAAWVFIRSNGNWTQQGAKLVPNDAAGAPLFGSSAALSTDGNTAIIGGPDDSGVGAVWIFTRSGGTWTQQGSKLVGTSAVGSALQGYAVALSADGNTAIVGGPGDASSLGAAWVFTRSDVTWTQEGSKLVGAGAVGSAAQGNGVALSSDGNTAIIGGIGDNSSVGAAWVFTRSASVWSAEGSKLVGSDVAGNAQQGTVALSGDGNTAIVGGLADNGNAGAAWIYTRSGGVWTQQGPKLVGAGAVGNAGQGSSVALSADGFTAAVGGFLDNSGIGAVWVFSLNGIWDQYGSKLVGTGAAGSSQQGNSVTLSGDGRIALVGGVGDNSNAGAAWVFVQTAGHDFDGDVNSDILWRNSTNGAVVAWLMYDGFVTQSAAIGTVPTHWQIVGQRDFDGDGKTDILWRDTTTGTVALWLMDGVQVTQAITVGTVASNWVISGVSDFNGDGKGDILWRDSTTGAVAIWLMNGATVTQSGIVGTVASSWVIAGTDAHGHIVWRNSSNGAVVVWAMNGLAVSQASTLGTAPSTWTIVGTGDFDGDGSSDLLWRNSSTGAVAIWFLVNGAVASSVGLGTVPAEWSIDLTGSFCLYASSDILWTNTTTGTRALWFMDEGEIDSTLSLGTVATTWGVQSMGAE